MNPLANHRSRPRGFTLVEMLVVLAVLVALSTIAVTSLEGVQDQTRYEATQRGLQNIEDAVLGPANQRGPDGSPLITGFVADAGRLPQASMNGSVLQPSELWENTNGLLPFGLRNAVAPEVPVADQDADVYVPCGWRGPYLRLGAGQTDLKDGWGNAYDLLKPDRTLCAAGDEVSIIRSLGLDNTVNGAATGDYREDIYINFNTNAFATPAYPAVSLSDRYHASPIQGIVKDAVNGNLNPANGDIIVVRYFGPDPITGGIKVVSQSIPIGTSTSVPYVLSHSSITIGTRTIRAYQVDSASNTVKKKSDVIRLALLPGGTPLDLAVK